MSNSYYTPTGTPSTDSEGDSALMRAEFVAIQTGFDLLPALTANLVHHNNAGGSAAIVTAGFSFDGTDLTVPGLKVATGTLEYPTGTTVGRWTTPAFNAADFTGSGSMTFTVAEADRVTYAYTILDKEMTVAVNINYGTVGGTPSTQLKVAIPAGKTATKTMYHPVFIYQNGTAAIGYASVVAAGTVINFLKVDGSNWAASTNDTTIGGVLKFEID